MSVVESVKHTHAPNADCYAAIDIGASSGRVVVGYLSPDNKLELVETYRFPTTQIRIDNHDCWDIEGLCAHVLTGLKTCADKGFYPKSVGIDTWGVDFVLLDADDRVLGHAVSYRDERTKGMFDVARILIPDDRLYQKTGIQRQPFNTIYQFLALEQEDPEMLNQARTFLMIPDYLAFTLTGMKANEYTNASTTGLLNAHTRMWDTDILDACNIPKDIFPQLLFPGDSLGHVLPSIAEEIGLDPEIILPATHDTGSAYLAVPAQDDQAVFLSSGTWSLLGVENRGAITTSVSQEENFTNEGGVDHTYRYLKNIMGLWMIQSIRRELNGVAYVKGEESDKELSHEACHARMSLGMDPAQKEEIGFGDLIAAAQQAPDFAAILDVNEPCFLSPGSMIEAIRDACVRHDQPVPQTLPELMQCVYQSLAHCYAHAIEQLSRLTNKTYTSINIVGGGCQDNYLNTQTAQACNLPVYVGPIEGTALGNILVQMIVDGVCADMRDARKMIRESFDIGLVEP